MSTSRYRGLDASHILKTIESVRRRIDARFPKSGLGGVCGELQEVGEAAAEFTDSLRRPIYPIRIISWFLIGLILILALAQFALLEDLSFSFGSVGDLMEAIEAMLSEMVLLGVAVLFLPTTEGRIKRHRSLKALRELRSIAHVVIGAVNEIEGLTSGLMGKIWQKIMILDRMVVEP